MDDMNILAIMAGAISSVVSGWVSWFFTRRRYNSEVENSLISNMKASLEFYQQLCTDSRDRLDESLARSAALENEVRDLRRQVMNMMTHICSNLSCKLRTNEQ